MIEITLQGLPKTPNQLVRMHWAAKHKESKRWRTMTAYAAKKVAPKKPFEAVTLTFVRHSSRRVDIDNGISALKPIIDGLKDGGIILDDNPNVVKSIAFDWNKAAPKEGFIKIIVMPIYSAVK